MPMTMGGVTRLGGLYRAGGQENPGLWQTNHLPCTLDTSQGQGAESIWSSPRDKETGKLRAIGTTTGSMKTKLFDYERRWRSILLDSTPHYYYSKYVLCARSQEES